MSFVLFLLYVTTSYIFPEELLPGLAPYRLTLWIGLACLGFSAMRSLVKGRFPAPLQIYFLAALCGVMALSTVLADNWLGGALATFNDFAPSLIMFIVALWNLDSIRKFKILATLMVLLSVYLAAQGVAAYHWGYRADQLLIADSDQDNDDTTVVDHSLLRIRGFGVMNDPNDLALGLVTTLPLLGLAWRKRSLLRNSIFVFAPLSVLLYGVYLTRSRGGLISVLLIALVGLAPRLGRVRAAFLACTLAVVSMALNATGGRGFSTKDESAAGRVAAWSEGLQMLKERPLLGVGYREFVDYNDKTAHNSFVLCFAELGLIGYFFWLGLLVTTFQDLMHIPSSLAGGTEGSGITRWSRTLCLSLLALLTAAFFLSRTYVATLYLILGMASALAELARRDDRSPVVRTPFHLTRLVSAWEVGSIAFMYLFVRINAIFVQ